MSPITAIDGHEADQIAEEPERAYDDLAYWEMPGVRGQIHVDFFLDFVLGRLGDAFRASRLPACGTFR